MLTNSIISCLNIVMYAAFRKHKKHQLKAVIIVGSVRPNRQADRVLKVVLAGMKNAFDCQVIGKVCKNIKPLITDKKFLYRSE